MGFLRFRSFPSEGSHKFGETGLVGSLLLTNPNEPRKKSFYFLSHRIHVWCIYLHLVDFYGRCRLIYHTWIQWALYWLVNRHPYNGIL